MDDVENGTVHEILHRGFIGGPLGYLLEPVTVLPPTSDDQSPAFSLTRARLDVPDLRRT
jgi:hypothetical protein